MAILPRFSGTMLFVPPEASTQRRAVFEDALADLYRRFPFEPDPKRPMAEDTFALVHNATRAIEPLRMVFSNNDRMMTALERLMQRHGIGHFVLPDMDQATFIDVLSPAIRKHLDASDAELAANPFLSTIDEICQEMAADTATFGRRRDSGGPAAPPVMQQSLGLTLSAYQPGQ